jgi:hypothetical protein
MACTEKSLDQEMRELCPQTISCSFSMVLWVTASSKQLISAQEISTKLLHRVSDCIESDVMIIEGLQKTHWS